MVVCACVVRAVWCGLSCISHGVCRGHHRSEGRGGEVEETCRSYMGVSRIVYVSLLSAVCAVVLASISAEELLCCAWSRARLSNTMHCATCCALQSVHVCVCVCACVCAWMCVCADTVGTDHWQIKPATSLTAETWQGLFNVCVDKDPRACYFIGNFSLFCFLSSARKSG